MNKLFDDTPYIDKTVTKKSYQRQKWKRKFQEYCESPQIRKESSYTGLNACGYWYACEECDIDKHKYPCSSALIQYLKKKNIIIDFKNTSKEYLDELLRLE